MRSSSYASSYGISDEVMSQIRQELIEEMDPNGEISENTARVSDKDSLPPIRRMSMQIVTSTWFEPVCGLVIAVNSLMIGIEQSARIRKQSTLQFDILEHVFLFFFVVEIILRALSGGRESIYSGWMVFDGTLVAMAILQQWIIAPFVDENEFERNVGPLIVMKAARFARLVRALRLLKPFHKLWSLVSGLIYSGRTMVDTIFVLIILLYIFSTVAIEMIRLDTQYDTHTSKAYRDLAHYYFPNLPLTMLTLLQFVCMDSIGSIYRPMIENRPALTTYFVAVIVVIAVVFMNIVTAVLVNSALEQAAEEQQAKAYYDALNKKKLTKQLTAIFKRMDLERKGVIERKHLLEASDEDKKTILDFMEMESPLHVFDQLDVDGNGTVDKDEFLEGLTDCALTKTPIELKRIDKRVRVVQKRQDAMADTLQAVHESVLAVHCGLQKVLSFHGIMDQLDRLTEVGTCSTQTVDSGIQDFEIAQRSSTTSLNCEDQKLDPVSQQLNELAIQFENSCKKQGRSGGRRSHSSTVFPTSTERSEFGFRPAMPPKLVLKSGALSDAPFLNFDDPSQPSHALDHGLQTQDADFKMPGTHNFEKLSEAPRMNVLGKACPPSDMFSELRLSVVEERVAREI